MTYVRKSEEDPVILKQRFKNFLKELENDASLGNLSNIDYAKSPRDSVIFDYFDYTDQTKAEQLFRNANNENYISKPIAMRLRVSLLLLEYGRISPQTHLQLLIEALISDRKLRRKIHSKKDERIAEDDPYADIVQLVKDCHCSITGTQADILNDLADKLSKDESVSLLTENGYLQCEKHDEKQIYLNLEKFTRDVIAVSITYQISDFFRYLEKKLSYDSFEKKPDLFLLYLKFESHNSLHEEEKQKNLLKESQLDEEINKALQYIAALHTKKNDLLIPVHIDSITGTGIYIAGSDYFIDQNNIDKIAKEKGKRTRSAGLNILYNQVADDGFAQKTIFTQMAFDKYKKNKDPSYYVGVFNQCCEMVEALLQALNGHEPVGVSNEYSYWYGTDDFDKVAEEIARQQDLMNG